MQGNLEKYADLTPWKSNDVQPLSTWASRPLLTAEYKNKKLKYHSHIASILLYNKMLSM